uniref:Uncharacterized protein n=1 Tax=Anguilla anguilla TaxID=7936 RepID=A0A0E9Q7M6_ANGAN
MSSYHEECLICKHRKCVTMLVQLYREYYFGKKAIYCQLYCI